MNDRRLMLPRFAKGKAGEHADGPQIMRRIMRDYAAKNWRVWFDEFSKPIIRLKWRRSRRDQTISIQVEKELGAQPS